MISAGRVVTLIGAECAPFIKLGGVGDVMGSLSQALAAEGVETHVILPRAAGAELPADIEVNGVVSSPVREMPARFSVLSARAGAQPLTYHFLDNPHLFGDRTGLYNDHYVDGSGRTVRGAVFTDNPHRFSSFTHGAIELSARLGAGAVLFNDWVAGLGPAFMKVGPRPLIGGTRGVLVVHNTGPAYQGVFDPFFARDTGIDYIHHSGDGIFHNGNLNFMKAGLQFADGVVVVSPYFAEEVRNGFGFGLEHMFNALATKGRLHGIMNGMDVE